MNIKYWKRSLYVDSSIMLVYLRNSILKLAVTDSI